MRIGPLEIAWRVSHKRRDDEAAVLSYLSDHPRPREIVCRMARSEVKNVLAEYAEQAEVPFDDPVSCLRNVWNLYQYGKSPAAQARDAANGLAPQPAGNYLRTTHGDLVDIGAIPPGWGACCVCGAVVNPAEGTGCTHPGHEECCGPAAQARDEASGPVTAPHLDLHNGEAFPDQRRSVPYTGPAPEPHPGTMQGLIADLHKTIDEENRT